MVLGPVEIDRTRATTWGKWLAFTIMGIALTAFRDLRLEIGGLLMHPYLGLATLLFVIALAVDISRFPDDLVRALTLFFAVFVFSTIPEPGGMDQIVKVGSSMVTIVLAAYCVRNEGDYRLAVIALVAAIAPIAIRGIISPDFEAVQGINPLEGVANKNGFSVFALPSVLLGGHLALDPSVLKRVRYAVGLGVFIIIFAIFSSGNRSGWLGVGVCLIAFLGIPRRRLRGFTWVILGGGILYWVVSTYGNTTVLSNRMEVTRTGYVADETRRELFSAAVQIGVENPILGVSPQRLPYDLAHRIHFTRLAGIDPHNVFGFLIGGCGLLTMGLVVYAAYVMYSKMKNKPVELYKEPGVQNAVYIMRNLVWLWAIRGMFSREILYNPCFCMALGMCFAYRRVHEMRAHKELLAAKAAASSSIAPPPPIQTPIPA